MSKKEREVEKGTGISFHMPKDRLLESIYALLWTCSLIMEGTTLITTMPSMAPSSLVKSSASYAVHSGVAAHVCVPWHLKGTGSG